FISADNGGKNVNGTVTWESKTVANNETYEVTFTVQVKADNKTKVDNTAEVQTGETGPKVKTNTTTNPPETPSTDPKKDVFTPGDLKQSINGKVVSPGEKLTYKVTYKNTTGKSQD
ncbi:hypothetical protein, partial [Porphyromonas sp. COT-290 OH3588]|uniref:hypothetical protein n=1 Tax=Porphyromonas sp. COT-290 OH3588 TaxID=1515617 RepID=UPI0005C59D86